MRLRIKSKKLRAFFIVLTVVALITVNLCSVLAVAASDATQDPTSTSEPFVYEPTGCWAWSGGKLFLVSSAVILCISILLSLIQAKRKFKD